MHSASPRRAFTLIEMLTVMAVIAILAGIILGVYNLAQTKASRARAEGEIKTLSLGVENYKADNGTVPRSADTDVLDPLKTGTPSAYANSSKYLYVALSGDSDPVNAPDFKITDKDSKPYITEFFKPSNLNCTKDSNGNILRVNYIQDPFGNCYGYSTLGAKTEEDYENQVRRNGPNTPRPVASGASGIGFNTTFDLWTTAGLLKFSGTDDASKQRDFAKWVKNW